MQTQTRAPQELFPACAVFRPFLQKPSILLRKRFPHGSVLFFAPRQRCQHVFARKTCMAAQLPAAFCAQRSLAAQLPARFCAKRSLAAQLPAGFCAQRSLAAQLPAAFCAKSAWQPSFPHTFARQNLRDSASRTLLFRTSDSGSPSATDLAKTKRLGLVTSQQEEEEEQADQEETDGGTCQERQPGAARCWGRRRVGLGRRLRFQVERRIAAIQAAQHRL